MIQSMVAVIARRTEDAGHRPLPKEVARFRAKSYVSHMNALGISPNDYDRVYEVAVVIYNAEENKGPFGVDHLIKAARTFNETNTKYVVFNRPQRTALVSCSTCQGSKLSYKMDGAKIVGLNRDEDGRILACQDCQNVGT
jgi:hypothetical protein